MWFYCPHWYQGTQEVLLALPLCFRSSCSPTCLLRHIPICHRSSTGNFPFQSWVCDQFAYICWCLLWCMVSTFRCHSGCHIYQWGLNHWGLHLCSPSEHTHYRHMYIQMMVISPCQECTEWLLPPLLWIGGVLCYSVSCPAGILAMWWGIQLLGLTEFTWSICLPYLVGRSLFQIWFHPITPSTMNLWWTFYLVILVWWLGVRFMSVLTPGLQNSLLLVHNIYPAFMVKVPSLTHLPLEPGCEDYSFLDQAVAAFEQGMDSILTNSIETAEIDRCFDKPDVITSSVYSGFICLVYIVSFTSKSKLTPSIRSHKLWCQARAFLFPVSLATKMSASKLLW